MLIPCAEINSHAERPSPDRDRALRGIRVGDILARKFGIYGRVAKALYYQEK